jgi:hypothetical protein
MSTNFIATSWVEMPEIIIQNVLEHEQYIVEEGCGADET